MERKGKGPVRVVDKSPSHTVGLKLIYGVPGSGKTYYASPSHTVGSEQRPSNAYVRYYAMLSSSHPVGLEPQITTSTKIRHINHFVKVAPFSNEVNFLKSKIMQS